MTQTNRNTTTSDRLATVLSYGVLILLGYLVFVIVAPFIRPLAWSAVMAIFFYPVYLRVEKHMRPTYAALLSTLGVTLLLIVPVLLVLLYASKEAIDSSAKIQGMINGGAAALPTHFIDWLQARLPDSLQNIDLMGPLRQGAERIASYLASSLGGLLKNLLSFFISLFIVLFALFFMLRDGKAILRAARHLIPFDPEIQESMLGESRDLIFASVAVALLIAAIQGTLGGIAFAIDRLASAGVHGRIDRVFFYRAGGWLRADLVSGRGLAGG